MVWYTIWTKCLYHQHSVYFWTSVFSSRLPCYCESLYNISWHTNENITAFPIEKKPKTPEILITTWLQLKKLFHIAKTISIPLVSIITLEQWWGNRTSDICAPHYLVMPCAILLLHRTHSPLLWRRVVHMQAGLRLHVAGFDYFISHVPEGTVFCL